MRCGSGAMCKEYPQVPRPYTAGTAPKMLCGRIAQSVRSLIVNSLCTSPTRPAVLSPCAFAYSIAVRGVAAAPSTGAAVQSSAPSRRSLAASRPSPRAAYHSLTRWVPFRGAYFRRLRVLVRLNRCVLSMCDRLVAGVHVPILLHHHGRDVSPCGGARRLRRTCVPSCS